MWKHKFTYITQKIKLFICFSFGKIFTSCYTLTGVKKGHDNTCSEEKSLRFYLFVSPFFFFFYAVYYYLIIIICTIFFLFIKESVLQQKIDFSEKFLYKFMSCYTQTFLSARSSSHLMENSFSSFSISIRAPYFLFFVDNKQQNRCFFLSVGVCVNVWVRKIGNNFIIS
jgi:hypothetical protein